MALGAFVPDESTRIVLRYYLYRATATVGFVTPIFTLFLLRDLSFTQIGALSALYSVLVVGGEIPTGYVGDRLGRRNSLVLGAVFKAASLLGFLAAESFAVYVVLYVLWAAGMTFDSGSNSAWLYETLAERLDETAFTRVRGRGDAVNRWVGAGTMLGGGALYAMDPTYPFVAATALVLVGVPVLFSLPEPGGNGRDQPGFGAVLALVWASLSTPPLRAFVLYTGLGFGVVSAANTYIQPIAVGLAGVPESALGPLYAGFTVVAAVGSYYAGTVESRLGRGPAVLYLPVVMAAVLFAPLAAPMLAIPAFVVARGGSRVLKPIAHGHLNDEVQSTGRATVVSATSMVYAAVRAPLALVGGVLADATSAVVAVAAFGAAFVLAGLALVLVESPIDGVDAGAVEAAGD